MALDPNIILNQTLPDYGNTLVRGFMLGQKIRQGYEKNKREAELQPMRQRLLEAQISQAEAQAAGAPAKAEAERLANEELKRKVMFQNASLLGDKVLGLFSQGKYDDAAKLVSESPLLTQEMRDEVMPFFENKDYASVLTSVAAVKRAGQERGYLETTTAGKRTLEKVEGPDGKPALGIFDENGNFIGYSKASPYQAPIAESGEAVKERVTNKRIQEVLNSAKDMDISPENMSNLKTILATGDMSAASRFLESVTTGRGLNVMAYRALFPEKSEKADKAIALAKREQAFFGKEAPEIASTSLKAAESIKDQISTYRQVLKLIDQGAGSGPIEQLFPAIKDDTIELQQLGGILALEALGSTNLTPVSNADIQLLKDNAIPKLDKGLKEWTERKIKALEKAQLFHTQRASYFQSGDANYNNWLNPNNWQEGKFTLLRRPGDTGPTTATTYQQTGTGDVPVMQERIPGYSPGTPPPPPVINYDPTTGVFSDQ